MRRLVYAIVVVFVVAGTSGTAVGLSVQAPAEGVSAPADDPIERSGGAGDAVGPTEAPPDPDEDVIGWEDGYWHNESIDVDRSDGLNDSELHAVVSRAMARVESVRQLEFEQRVPVEVISREEFAESNRNRSDPSAANRLHQNAKFEATFLVGEGTDAISVQQSSSSASVLGYYSPTEERIVIVSENTTAPKMNEITLSQELFHALQDQHFNLSAYNQTTREL
ncbi:MAG: Hvo_1808 family surface protein, partial [Halobacteriales archaeon]